MSDVLERLRSIPCKCFEYPVPPCYLCAAIREIERLRAIIRPGDAAAYEESHAAKDAEIARLREQVEALRALGKAKNGKDYVNAVIHARTIGAL